MTISGSGSWSSGLQKENVPLLAESEILGTSSGFVPEILFIWTILRCNEQNSCNDVKNLT